MPITIPHPSAENQKKCTVTVGKQEDNNDGPPSDFCSLLKIGEAKHVGNCLVPERQTQELRFNIEKDCKCYAMFKYGSAALGVEHILHTYCEQQTKVVLTQNDFERCSCKYKPDVRIYRSRLEKTIKVSTFSITNNFDHYKRYIEDFVYAPEKWYRYVERRDDGSELQSSWQKVVLVGNSYTQLNPFNDKDAEIRYLFELQFTQYAEAVTNWR